MKPSVQINFRLPCRIEQDGDVWISCCDLLDVQSQGNTQQNAAEMLTEALQLFIETCIEEGSIDAVMRECGFALGGEAGEFSPAQEDDAEYLDVPVCLLAASYDGQTHAR